MEKPYCLSLSSSDGYLVGQNVFEWLKLPAYLYDVCVVHVLFPRRDEIAHNLCVLLYQGR